MIGPIVERREVLALGSLALILTGGGLAWWRLFGRRRGREHVRLEEVYGQVERVRGRDRAAATAGEALAVGDLLQTGADGRAVIGFGEGGRVVLKPEGRVEVLAAEERLVRLELEEGTVEATLRPDDAELGILAAGREFLSGDGNFLLSRRPGAQPADPLDDIVGLQVLSGQVASREPDGPVGITGADGRQIWIAGQPAEGPLSESLLLAVSWPDTRTRAGTVPVRGRTEPGARVRVHAPGGVQEVTAGVDGQFVVEVALLEGGNRLEVEVLGVMGGGERAEGAVERDTKAPAVSVQIRDR